ncbi:MAG: histidinol-phosphate transaminase [Alphaproteobacteria bacterium]|nr:histidinol-phosphate transaminase [Alphaproteobacteria bacterium]
MTSPKPKESIMQIKPYVGGKSKADGAQRIIKLSSNENPWGPSPKAIAAFEAAAKNLHRYPDGGHMELRETLSKTHGFPENELICGSGSDELIGLLIHAFAGKGDEVLYSQYGFLMYKIYTLANEATPVTAPEKELHFDVDAMLAAVTPRTKILFIANPNNPTGTYIPFSEIKRLRAGLREDVILALDAAYAEYMDVNDYDTGHGLVKDTNTVVFHTFSKIFGLPALRLGWAHGPAAIIDAMNRIRSPFNVTAPALAAGVAALHDTAFVPQQREKNAIERKRVCDTLKQLGLGFVQSHTNFVLVHFGSTQKATEANQFLTQRGLIVRDTVAYGLPEYLRISFGTSEENNLLTQALNDFVASRNAA